MKKILSLILVVVLGITLYSTLLLTNSKLEYKNIKNNIKKVEKKVKKLKKENSDIEDEFNNIKETNTSKVDEYNIWLRAKEKLEKAI